MGRRLLIGIACLSIVVPGGGAVAAAQPTGTAPGAPGAEADYLPADKTGFGTSRSTASPVWYTLQGGRLSEIYYPDITTPSTRSLEFAVTDGRTFTLADSRAHVRTSLADARSLTYRQVVTDPQRRWELTKTYVTDPARAGVLVDVGFRSLTGRPYRVHAVFDPDLSGDGNDDFATARGGDLVAADARAATALAAAGGFRAASAGYVGASDGWADLADHRMDWRYASAPDGNVALTALTALDGVRSRHTTLAIGFGRDAGAAVATARASLRPGFGAVAGAYAAGWHRYLAGLPKPPASLRSDAERRAYTASLLVLAAGEDKTYRGAFVASPSMPWAWAYNDEDLVERSGPYHLIWPRDQYQVATALLAAGDRAAAGRALGYMFDVQQEPDGHLPQNTYADGTPYWTSVQLDQTADPIILAWQLGRTDARTWSHVKRAADFMLAFEFEGRQSPYTQQERWEEQSGYSPGTIAAVIAGLVCAAEIARANGDAASAARYLAAADEWQRQVDRWTVTTNGPYGPRPYYVRLTKDGNPNAGTRYDLGNSGTDADQRAVVDPSFLELVRLGVKCADDPVIRNTAVVVDRQLSLRTPTGQFWHRYSGDGYGETATGAPWDVGFPAGSRTTIGRLWPIFAGERGEYELLAGGPARQRLADIAATANAGLLMPEQVWDANPPSGSPGYPPGRPTFSATPLLWTHAQYVRLAVSIDAGRPVERPDVVARRYGAG